MSHRIIEVVSLSQLALFVVTRFRVAFQAGDLPFVPYPLDVKFLTSCPYPRKEKGLITFTSS